MTIPNTITVSGNLTGDPEVRKTGGDVPFTTFRMAVNRRVFVAETGTWEDRNDGFFKVVAWRELARHTAACLEKGDRVVVTGRLSRRPYEVQVDGGETETRYSVEIEADDIGGSMRWYQWRRLVPRETSGHSAEEAQADADGAAEEEDDDGDVVTRAA